MATVATDAGVAPSGSEAWDRLGELARRAPRDRDGVLAELDALFAGGRPSAGIDGDTRGRFVAFAVQPRLDRVLAAVALRWMPWSGKRFDAAAGRGKNLLFGGRLRGYPFRTLIERGRLRGDPEVLVIDYAAVPSSRWLGLGRVRDELVEIAPGVHLGQALWRGRGGRHALIAYWALRSSGA